MRKVEREAMIFNPGGRKILKKILENQFCTYTFEIEEGNNVIRVLFKESGDFYGKIDIFLVNNDVLERLINLALTDFNIFLKQKGIIL